MTKAPETPSGGWERSDTSGRPAVIFAAILLVFLVAVGFGARLLLDVFATRANEASAPAHPLAPALGTALPPAPRLQNAPRKDLAQLRAEEQAVLDGTGWVDRSAGIAHVPIERAMAMLAERAAKKGGR